jgi:hypothetical protein
MLQELALIDQKRFGAANGTTSFRMTSQAGKSFKIKRFIPIALNLAIGHFRFEVELSCLETFSKPKNESSRLECS